VENLTMARRLLVLMGKSDALLRYVADRPGHDRRYALDCTKIQVELGCMPCVPLDDGLRQTVDWYRDNGDWVANVRDGIYRSYYEKYYENREVALRAFTATNENREGL
jgi:dTDP-glucose 4,6-dehydratase